MKQSYDEAILEILIFTGEDVIATSETPPKDENETDLVPFS